MIYNMRLVVTINLRYCSFFMVRPEGILYRYRMMNFSFNAFGAEILRTMIVLHTLNNFHFSNMRKIGIVG